VIRLLEAIQKVGLEIAEEFSPSIYFSSASGT
jgi:hypothetical protein